MFQTYAQRLLHYAQIEDILEREQFQALFSWTKLYVEEVFDLPITGILLEGPASGQAGLRPWGQEYNTYGSFPLHIAHQDELKVNGQCAFSYLKGKPVWIVASDQTELNQATDYQDLWSELENIPPYIEMSPSAPKTLIAVPLKRRTEVFGLLYFESPTYLVPHDRAQQELLTLGEAIGLLYSLVEQSFLRQENTSKVVAEIKEFPWHKEMFHVVKPQLFFAYPQDTDLEVTGTITAVLNEYADRVNVIDWQDLARPGIITQQIVEAIQKSDLAICYLSEYAPSGIEPCFQDNPNVLFEAGIIHGLTHDTNTSLHNWIPVREEEAYTTPMPFDLSDVRVLRVRRKANREVNVHLLSIELRKMLDEVLGDESS